MSLGTVGKYERLDVLGHGASGIVYLARDTLLRRQVAIKEVSAQGEERERLLEEARVLDRLRHPNIVAIHGVDTINGKIVIDMEYVDGENLLDILRRNEGEPLPVATAVNIAAQVCDGLAYAQERHIVHRDIKPANILVTKSGQVKLVDFGLAQVLGTNSFVGGAGTYAYMAPEDFDENGASGAQADIWALGVILYEMLIGRRPFSVARPKDPFAWKRAIEAQPIEPPSRLRPEVSEELSDICLAALQRDRALRFQTAAAMDSALRSLGMQQAAGEIPAPKSQANGYRSGPVTQPTLLGASDVDTFLSIAPKQWESARATLVHGDLGRWLRSIDESPLAEIAERLSAEASNEESDHDALLRDFLYRSGLDTSAFSRREATAGSSFLRAGAFDDAASALIQAIRLDPSHASYFLQLQKALMGAGDAPAAAAAVARGLEYHPKDRSLRREMKRLRETQPVISPTSIDFGALRHGDSGKLKVVVRNAAGAAGAMNGRVASAPAWLEATPMTFVTRHQQPIQLVANTKRLWQRGQAYDGRVEIETSGGTLSLPVRMTVKPPMRSFQEVFWWLAPLTLLALAPLIAGEIATIRHLFHHHTLPFYAAGMLASGLLFAAVRAVCVSGDVGPSERSFITRACILAPLGAWLCWIDKSAALWPAAMAAFMPTGLLLIAQGFAMWRAPGAWGRWSTWAVIIAVASVLITIAFWQQTKIHAIL